ncbi:iron-containing alcohol dehydrogenase [Silvanigrella aquatica]|uniref:3-dehydroquinate synthase domain-containing protein n=1 Tax=Silvanigrella aquatica TaxID=1915309 RepID=A0A1L4D3P9_9BACT|nr:iron-containing alcohol dehydrogenase [Silvanigrella aquatica]APJ04844.1 hypothetical protein AXG55_13430 [Silvanigrella aquatica]
MRYFDLISQTLKNQNIGNNLYEQLPLQFYSTNYHDFYDKIKNYLDSCIHKFGFKNNVFILTDSKDKLSEIKNSKTINEKIIDLLSSDFNVIHKSLSVSKSVDTDEIHASEYYLNETINLIEAEKNNFIFISLGSGAITDLLKHALYLNKKDTIFISIPTAMTVTAFTSSFSVVDLEGAKRTRQSKIVNATFWIEPLLQAAPLNLSRAGFGDLLARFVAYGDWYLSYKLGIAENYNELAYHLMEIYADPLKQMANCFQQEFLTSDAIEIISASLAMAGISMSLSGETTPLSGYEHVISHGLDFLRLTSRRSLVLHGEQVALASLTSAMTFDWLLEFEEFDTKKMRTMNEKEIQKIITQFMSNAPFFGNKNDADEINPDELNKVKKIFAEDYIIKSDKWNLAKENISEFQNNWAEIKTHITKITMRSDEMQRLLEQANLPTYPEATFPTTTALEFRWALRFSPFIRSRFSVADFIFWIGEDPCIAAAI